MPFDGSGNFTRTQDFESDRDNGIKILAGRVDDEFDNFASGMNQVFFRSGLVPMTGNINMGTNRLIGLGNGTALTPAMTFNIDGSTGVFLNAVAQLGFSAASVTTQVHKTSEIRQYVPSIIEKTSDVPQVQYLRPGTVTWFTGGTGDGSSFGIGTDGNASRYLAINPAYSGTITGDLNITGNLRKSGADVLVSGALTPYMPKAGGDFTGAVNMTYPTPTLTMINPGQATWRQGVGIGASATNYALKIDGAAQPSFEVSNGGGTTFNYRVGRDTQFYMDYTSNPFLNFDTNDYMAYERTTNKFLFFIGSSLIASIDSGGNLRCLGNIFANTAP